MEKLASLFWPLILLLLGASLFFGINAEKQRRSVQSGSGRIDNGDIVKLVRIIDGDSALMAKEGQQPVTVRLIGIKSFDAKVERDVVTPFGQAARESLQRMLADRPVRVLLNANPKDRYGRYLATLYADDQDVALKLVRQGLAIVYTVYPFPSMQLYLQEQESAKAGRRGLWASNDASERAMAMIREWQVQNQ